MGSWVKKACAMMAGNPGGTQLAVEAWMRSPRFCAARNSAWRFAYSGVSRGGFSPSDCGYHIRLPHSGQVASRASTEGSTRER